MSTDILSDAKAGSEDKNAASNRLEELGEYVRRTLREKRLTIREVEKRSGGKIDQSYVGRIAQGIYPNLTVDKVKALAAGLGVNEDEIFNVARRVEARPLKQPEFTDQDRVLNILDMIRRIVSDQPLMETVGDLVSLSPEALQSVEKLISVLIQNDAGSVERSKTSQVCLPKK
jgi:transcriptional regulator with XRE-family HTH domain